MDRENIGQIATESFSATLSKYQGDIKQHWHSHDEFILTMLLKGNVREEVSGNDRTIGPFEVGMKAPDVRHTDHFCPNGVSVIRLALSPKFVSELKARSLINEGWYWETDSEAIRPFLKIGQTLLSKNGEIEDDVYEIIASMLPAKKSFSDPPFWLKQAKEQIDDTCDSEIRLNYLAESVGVHPVYFARRFKQFWGCSVGSYIRKKQFQKVHDLVISENFNLAQIAAEAGFCDQPHLTRTFVREFGITPANFRRLLS